MAKLEAMRNQAMRRKLEAGEAIDVRAAGAPLGEGPAERGVYVLREFVDDVDYCDAELEAWIWSIGRELAGEHAGRILASTDARFYQNPAFDCLWLR